MSKRALILWSCFGLLLLTAAKVTAVYHPPSASPTPAAAGSRATTSPDDAKLKLLSAAYGPGNATAETPQLTPAAVNESTIWLARAIYSETKFPHEQELVAWVVRNRVETEYRGRDTYKEVVLDPYQFSAFNPGSSKRSFYLSLTPDVQLSAWQQALWIAHYVQHADSAYRPFSIETRHFYSERSMKGRRHPYWVERQQFVSPVWEYTVNKRRFRFYKEIS
ncbi:MAG: hypothetical protein BRD55_11230 [Bacteroidetes bacterium SW_9_63_38]|nr:MAG: hypothetical protein BRD55_11230 [Bacteroidetes bacterium SW_9_63_38]